MHLVVGVGAVFFILHVVTARRFAPLIPGRMVTRWSPGPAGLVPAGTMSKRWGLRMGALLSLFVSGANLAVGTIPGVLAPVFIAQVVMYWVFLWMYRQNARFARENREK